MTPFGQMDAPTVRVAPPERPRDDLQPGEMYGRGEHWLMGCPCCGAIVLIEGGTQVQFTRQGMTLLADIPCPRCRVIYRVINSRVCYLQ